jgi:hypothetical protein
MKYACPAAATVPRNHINFKRWRIEIILKSGEFMPRDSAHGRAWIRDLKLMAERSLKLHQCLKLAGVPNWTFPSLRDSSATRRYSSQISANGAAQESNLPSRGLHDLTGFEYQLAGLVAQRGRALREERGGAGAPPLLELPRRKRSRRPETCTCSRWNPTHRP